MQKLSKIKYTLSLIILIMFIPNIFGVSHAVKSLEDYEFMLSTFRTLSIIIPNFGNDTQKKKYEELKDKFQSAAERHYSQNYVREYSITGDTEPDNNEQASVEMFYQLKVEVNTLLEEIAQLYLDRTKLLLDSTAKQATTILIEFSKESGLGKYFYQPVNPLTDKKPYDPKEYHYFHKRDQIENNLQLGYKLLEDARRVYKHPDYIYILFKKTKTSKEINYLIQSHLNVIILTRQSKKNGVYIHQLINEPKLSDILSKYEINMGQVNKFPIYDDRIPQEFKIDALDSFKMVYDIELKRLPDSQKYLDANSNTN
ncbi:MAG: hypothetical protein JW982_11110 [Spirochaetes bacterium]|nr:hypothetical protein [Spirochaetota bacterium]